jgi:hypothetical protein
MAQPVWRTAITSCTQEKHQTVSGIPSPSEGNLSRTNVKAKLAVYFLTAAAAGQFGCATAPQLQPATKRIETAC